MVCSVVASEEVSLNQLNQDVQHLDVQLLHPICELSTGRAQVDVGQCLQRGAIQLQCVRS